MASIKGAVREAKRNDKAARRLLEKLDPKKLENIFTGDSLQNFAAALGMGTGNLISSSTYGFNPVTRIRTLMEWIHRGSWLGGVVIDVVADDMTREGVKLKGDIAPEDIAEIEENIVHLGVWNQISDTIKWGRLFGGAIGVYLIDGQDMSTPFRIETVGKDQFRGILPLDRWQVDPSLENLVTQFGPDFGLPKYYRVTSSGPLSGKRIHHTRCFRYGGAPLSFYQKLQENLWDASIIERLYDRMVAFDSGTQGVAQLLFKSYLRTYKIKNLRETIAAGGKAAANLLKFVDFMRQTQSNEGVTLLDGDDEFETIQNTTFAGSHEAVLMLGEQLSGATGIPLVRIFGQSPAGLNSTGDFDLRMYYDTTRQQQNRRLRTPVTTVYRLQAQSLGIKLGKGFGIEFRPLWQLTESEKADVASKNTETIMKVQEKGIISDRTALLELKQMSDTTGVWTNISNEDIEAANDVPAPPVPEEGGGVSEGET